MITLYTCTILEINDGSIEKGKRRMLKRERETKALVAVSLSSGLSLLR